MNEIMGDEQVHELCKIYLQTVLTGDYNEALKINNRLYENSYKEYIQLVKLRNNSLSYEERVDLEIQINLLTMRLEKSIENTQRIQELNLSKRQK